MILLGSHFFLMDEIHMDINISVHVFVHKQAEYPPIKKSYQSKNAEMKTGLQN